VRGYRVTVLSALYGFLRPTELIQYYNLSMAEVPARCKRALPRALDVLREILGLEAAAFMTSKTYFEPFAHLGYAYRLAVRELWAREDPYCARYYAIMGKVFRGLATGSLGALGRVKVVLSKR